MAQSHRRQAQALWLQGCLLTACPACAPQKSAGYLHMSCITDLMKYEALQHVCTALAQCVLVYQLVVTTLTLDRHFTARPVWAP